jgi:hypothetical protein
MARRGEVVAALHHVVHKCGARDLEDVIALLKEDAGRDYLLQLLESDECRTAAAAATAFSDVPMPPVNVVLRVAAPPPPPPIVKAVLLIRVPRVPVAAAGTMTDCRTQHAQSQTARRLYEKAANTQTEPLPSAVENRMVVGAASMVHASTDCYLDKLALGMHGRAVQTEISGPVVAASDFAELHTSMAAAVESDSQASKAERKAKTDLVGMLKAIVTRKDIQFPDGALYEVYCKGEVDNVTDWARVYKLTCGPMDWL